MAEGYIPRAFCCKKCGWILGESYREENSRITQLRVYRFPRHPREGLNRQQYSKPFMQFAAMQVNDAQIPCSCGEVNGWYANQNAIAEMIERKHGREETVRADGGLHPHEALQP